LICDQVEGIVRLQEELSVGFFETLDLYSVQYGHSHGLHQLKKGLAQFPGMQLTFRLISYQVLNAGKSEAGYLFLFHPECFLQLDDFFQLPVQPIDMAAEGINVYALAFGDQFITAVFFKSYFMVREQFGDPPDAFITHGCQLQHFIFSHGLGISHQFRKAAEAGESRIAGAGPGRNDAPFDDGDRKGWMMLLQIISAP